MPKIDLSNENIVHIKKDGIEYLQFRKLLEYKNIQHCFTLAPLNFESNSSYETKKEEVAENYKKICKSLNLDYKNIIRPYQTHTANIEIVKDIFLEKPSIFSKEYKEIDGLITNKTDKVLSLTYADCIPLYFFEPEKNVIANIHSGWMGTTKKIGKIAVQKMIDEYECKAEKIICCIGPTIRKCHFEVEKDVKNIFENAFSYENIDKKQNNKYYIDAVEINKKMLLEAGLKQENIIDSKICTVCNCNKMYSYRGNAKTELRNTAIICLK